MCLCKTIMEENLDKLIKNVEKYGWEFSCNVDQANRMRGYVDGMLHADVIEDEEYRIYHGRINTVMKGTN